jgi:hypothetical protein
MLPRFLQADLRVDEPVVEVSVLHDVCDNTHVIYLSASAFATPVSQRDLKVASIVNFVQNMPGANYMGGKRYAR